jgi:hypothetical protein
MTLTVLDNFPPLQSAIAQAESWTSYLKARRPESGNRRPEEVAVSLEPIVWVGVKLGELLPFTWRLTFDTLFRPGEESWTTVKEFETVRQAVYRLFFTAREAMDWTRQVAEALQTLTGRKPAGMDRLLRVIEDARQLEEAVFRDWPSFGEPRPSVDPADSLPVDESLAETLGITVEEARQRLDARRGQLNPGGDERTERRAHHSPGM